MVKVKYWYIVTVVPASTPRLKAKARRRARKRRRGSLKRSGAAMKRRRMIGAQIAAYILPDNEIVTDEGGLKAYGDKFIC